MKKLISIALVLVILGTFCVPVMATEGAVTAAGFYNIGTAENVTITAVSASGATVTAETVDVNADGENDTFYANSDALTVTYSAATAGAYYGVIMVDGTGLPTKENTIFYINQVTADSTSVTFNVKPLLPTASGVCTLYITSNAVDAAPIPVTLSYAINGTYSPASSAYLKGDVDNTGVIDSEDSLGALQLGLSLIENPDPRALVAADVDESGVIDSKDALYILQYSLKLITEWPSAAE